MIIEISGTYNLIRRSNETLLELDFNSKSEIVGSCTSTSKKTMRLQSEIIFLSSWNACDALRLKYEKTD